MKDVPSYDEQPKENKSLDVYPIKKGKRVLLFLCDLVIAFFVSFVFYTAAVVPISEAATNLNARREGSIQARLDRNSVLEDNLLLYKQYETQDLESKMEYTCEQYARYYSVNTIKVSNPDIFHHFYFEVRSLSEKYINEVKNCDSVGFFDINESTKTLTLKETYRVTFNQGFAEGGSFTDEGKKIYDSFYRTYFLNMYGEMLIDIQKNDLSSTIAGRSTYNTYQAIVDSYQELFRNTVVVDCYISMFLGVAICYLIIPLCNRNRKTISMFFMRLEKVNKDNFELKSRKSLFANFVYQLALNAALLFFIPMISVDFAYIFSLVSIVPIAAAGLIIQLASLIILLFDEYNRPLSDKFSNTIMISTDTLEDIYRVRGYNV